MESVISVQFHGTSLDLTDIGIVKLGPRVHTFKNGWISGSFEHLSIMSLHSLHITVTKLVFVSWQTRARVR
jgi:hypothetical protein